MADIQSPQKRDLLLKAQNSDGVLPGSSVEEAADVPEKLEESNAECLEEAIAEKENKEVEGAVIPKNDSLEKNSEIVGETAAEPIEKPEVEAPAPKKRGRKPGSKNKIKNIDTTVDPQSTKLSVEHKVSDILTIDPGRAGTEQKEDAQMFAWHELQNSRIKSKILTGTLVSMERFPLGDGQVANVAIVNYKGYRIMIPVSEMNIVMDDSNDDAIKEARASKITANMVGCDIDFIVNQLDEASKSVVGSRKRAMQRKINNFYIEPSERSGGMPMINVDSLVEARVVAVAESALRLEVFGAECFVRVFDMSRAWISDAREKYYVGQKVAVRVLDINIDGNKHVKIRVEGKSIEPDEFYSCSKQSRYLGTVTGFSKGTYFVRLDAGVNAVAHSCDGVFPLPQKNDKVIFICIRMDDETHVAVGIITRIVRPAVN